MLIIGIPAYNEEKNIASILLKLKKIADKKNIEILKGIEFDNLNDEGLKQLLVHKFAKNIKLASKFSYLLLNSIK